MNAKMFYKFDSKHKTLYILSKLIIMVLIILMGILAVKLSGLELPTVSEQIKFAGGVVLIIVVVLMALLNRIRTLFKIKSLGFVLTFLILLAFSYTIETLVWSIGLISIPLLIDDIIINPLWINYYYDKVGD